MQAKKPELILLTNYSDLKKIDFLPSLDSYRLNKLRSDSPIESTFKSLEEITHTDKLISDYYDVLMNENHKIEGASKLYRSFLPPQVSFNNSIL